MTRLITLTVPLLCLAGAAMAQTPGMPRFNDNQTGHAVDPQRLSGLRNPNTQPAPNMAGAGPYSAPATGPLTTATSPPAPDAAMTPGSGPYAGTGMTPNGAMPAPK